MPQELSRLEVVARLDAAVVAAEEAAGAVVLLPRVPARVALVRAFVLREGWRVGALARICAWCFTDLLRWYLQGCDRKVENYVICAIYKVTIQVAP